MLRVALVTGAYRGLGLETVRQLVHKGYQVVLTARKTAAGRAAVEQLMNEGLKVIYHDLEVNDFESIKALAQYLEQSFGKLDVLVNNAGIHYDLGNDVLDPDWQIIQEAMDTNYLAPWKVVVGLMPLLKKSDNARIVNVSSGAGSLADVTPGTPAYSASKAALNMLTIQISDAIKDLNFKVNSVCPGWVRTDMGGPSAPRSIEEGALGIVWAATLHEDGPTGGFFRDGQPIAW